MKEEKFNSFDFVISQNNKDNQKQLKTTHSFSFIFTCWESGIKPSSLDFFAASLLYSVTIANLIKIYQL